MFEDFWYSIRDGLVLMIVPSSAVLGLHLMNKLVPQLTPACEVRK